MQIDMAKEKIRVLIVDDSALIRKLLTEILSSDPGIDVVGTAMDPQIARRKIKELNPDVITLDVEMPKMDGLSFLRILMRLRPMPVVMISSLTARGAEITMDALEAGAVDFVSKPTSDISGTLQDFTEEITGKVKAAAKAKVYARSEPDKNTRLLNKKTENLSIDEKFSATAILKRPAKNFREIQTTDKVIAIGASTGGTEAIKEILTSLPADIPSIVIAQHIPPVFSEAFARRMNQISDLTVSEASDNQLMVPGHVYIAPGDLHLLVKRDGAKYRCQLSDGPPVNRHRPSVDVLFRSVAQNVGKNAVGIILTGMGADGARGLHEMLESGASTIAQDEKTSVVWGMPGEAVKIGAAENVLALQDISVTVQEKFKNAGN
ncbi:MAG TPA: chemotaxis response regulator protein-glutamate methylesterase [Gammaproteobacteria bacterium]|nr:chemotaxis response regulator protein-glutamate methylesterase [Gammaproteobacteria bacterium]